jgi:hypothetical protein
MKDDYVCGIGYHFSRFRAKGWRGLYIENRYRTCKSGRLEEIRVLRLKGLYCVGILLMAVGFLICFNAIYRVPGARRTTQAVTPVRIEAIEANEAAPVDDSDSAYLKGRGD